MPELLLHSLATFDPLITELLDVAGARSVVEIGGEGGLFTRQLVDWAERVDGSVHCVDPAPSQLLARLATRAERLTLLEEPSPAALDLLPFLDAYIVDGDHNHHTVHAELTALLPRLLDPERPALVVLHDVAWPSARRDSYYAPERLPEAAVHEHSRTLGAVPGEEELQAVGFSPAGRMAYATREGGPRNGVLTAVEDVLGERAELELHVVPAVFGVGVLFASAAPWAQPARDVVAPYLLPLVERLEHNRIELFLQVLRLQAEVEHRARVHQLQLDGLQARLAASTPPG